MSFFGTAPAHLHATRVAVYPALFCERAVYKISHRHCAYLFTYQSLWRALGRDWRRRNRCLFPLRQREAEEGDEFAALTPLPFRWMLLSSSFFLSFFSLSSFFSLFHVEILRPPTWLQVTSLRGQIRFSVFRFYIRLKTSEHIFKIEFQIRFFVFLGATKHLYNWLCPSVGRLVGNALV